MIRNEKKNTHMIIRASEISDVETLINVPAVKLFEILSSGVP